MRGSNILFADIFETPPSEVQHGGKKGRCPELNHLRNECLVERFYYYGKFFDKRYTTIIETLAREFFLSEITVPKVISANRDQLTSLRKQQPAIPYFKKRWPHLTW
jgi:hypothetical protein